MKTQRYLFLAGLLIVALTAACTPGSAALPQQGVTPVPQTSPVSNIRSLTVNGSGEVFLPPDIAYINIGVHTEGENASAALSSNTGQIQAVIDALKAQGIAEKDIQTSSFNIYPSQTYGPNNEVTGTRYMVDNVVYVTVRDLSRLGDTLQTVVSTGANSINGITFDVADKTAAQVEARKQAVDKARALAEELAGAAGVGLGEIQSINIATNNIVVPLYEMGRGGGAAMASADVPIQTGQVSIKADVTMVFQIQ